MDKDLLQFQQCQDQDPRDRIAHHNVTFSGVDGYGGHFVKERHVGEASKYGVSFITDTGL